MARHNFGGGIADWAFTDVDGVDGEDNLAQLTGAVTLTFFDAETGGSQVTDLLDENGSAVDHVTSDDGTGARAPGQIPPFQGPDETWVLWASADGGPRKLMVATDVGTTLGPQVLTLVADTTAHLAALNPHGTRFQDLDDVNAPTPTDGQAPLWDDATSRWVPGDVDGVSGTVNLTSDQTIAGTKIFDTNDVNKTSVEIHANVGQVADIFVCRNNAGERTGYFNEKGELRAIAAADNSVAVRFKGNSAGQTADLTQWTDNSLNPGAWVDASFRMRAPNLGHVFTFAVKDNIAVGSGTHRIYNDTGVQLTIRAIRATLGTPPVGSSAIFDVHKNGTTIFTTQANRPTVADGANTSGKVTNMNTTTWNDGEFMTVDIDQAGSGTPGADLVVQILAY